jgi:hypothetical protein
MSADQEVKRDERTVAVKNVGYKWAYGFIVFALLIDVCYRSAIFQEAPWDLLALVVVGGAICAIFQVRHKTLGPGWLKAAVIITCLGAIFGIISVAVMAMIRAI